MTYFILGVTINGSHFWVDNIHNSCKMAIERNKIASTVAYFGGGSVTVYKVDDIDNVFIYSFEKVDGNPEIPLNNEEIC